MSISKLLFKYFISVLVLFTGCTFANSASIDSPHAWGTMEYLYWWTQNSPIGVPLVTRNNNPAYFGFITDPGTQIIFGAGSNKNAFDYGGISGGRITIGSWIGESHQYGIEGSGFSFPRVNNSFTASSVGGAIPVINIPFISAQSLRENVLVGGLPNTAIVTETFHPVSFELNGLYNLRSQTDYAVILLAGVRYMNIREDLQINDSILNNPSLPNNAVLNVSDSFNTNNKFYGIQIGARSNFTYHHFVFDLTAELALGQNYQTLIINGQTNVNGTILIQPIGLFAEPTNIGTFRNNQLTYIPSLQIKMGYKLYKSVRPFITYNFTYINNIIRPGKEIDRTINLSQNILIGGTGVLSGPALPSVQFNQVGMWLQGFGIGVEFDIG